MRKVIAGVLACCLTIVGVAAWGFWSGDSATGGNGGATATSVAQGSTPTATLSGQSVTVSWTASALANGQPVSGYQIKRYDASTLAVQTILSACTGTVASTTCTENSVPTGSWQYTVTPVFSTNWRGVESAKSTALDVDATPPTNALALSSVSGGAYLAATTLYYRGSAAGSFTITNSLTDANSGPASSSTSALAGTTTGWTHTPSTVSTPAGGPYVSNVFSWIAGTTSAPQDTVTGRDVSANTAATTLSFVNDSTAPTATVSYLDGFATSKSLNVSFTESDTGSGLGTRQLQRQAASLTNGVCGTYGSWYNQGLVNPTSPYVDTNLGNQRCYKYQYVVTDRVGNTFTATSASIAKVDYDTTVKATTGLLSQWRLSEASATLGSSDSFTGPSGALVTSGPGEIGATWAYLNGSGNTETLDAEGRAYRNGSGYNKIYTTATPPTADYSVEADLVVKSVLADDRAGVLGRIDTATTSYYMARWEETNNSWNIEKLLNNAASPTYLASTVNQPALVAGQAYRIKLEMVGSSLKLYVNGVLTTSATDTSLTAAGKAGLADGASAVSSVTKSATTGLHFDNFQVAQSTYPRAADDKGTNTGDYKNGPTLGVAGALSNDPDTAASFDGLNDYVQFTGTTGIPVGASTRSVEAWFKTTSGNRQVLFAYGSAANTQEYGLWLNSGGAGMTAWGFGTGNDKVFTLASAVNDGAWHQVVQTYSGSVLTLYIDGVALPTQAATRSTTMDGYGFGIGAIINPTDGNSGGFFTGSIDEVSLYTTVLSQSTVTDHYQLATGKADLTGPTGGSVDASGLTGTGARYSTSTSLSIVLSDGTDPSGVAASGTTLTRASASLSNGTCGTFGSYALVTGGNDPATPYADTVADQACYSYKYTVLDTWGNASTYTSPGIKVDTTVPTPAPSLAYSAFTNSSASGSTIYYRSGAASGSFTVTGTGVADPASGIATYDFPALGTGWTSTPGTLGVNTYSWSPASPAAPGTQSVTATNNAGLASAGTPFTLVSDNAAPSAGSITYADGGTQSTSVSVSFTSGTDTGSGVFDRQLQRASAPLTDSTCGTYSAFATVTNGTNAASPYTDATLSRATCYKYRSVVTDNVGNSQVDSSASVVKVWPTYYNAVNGQAGLGSWYRLGETTTSQDSFTDTAGISLQTHVGETGATWTSQAGNANASITAGGRIRKAGTGSGGARYYASAVPASADYTVNADVYVASNVTDDMIGVMARDDLAASPSYYVGRYEQASQKWVLYRVNTGTFTTLGSSAVQALTVGSTYHLALDLVGSNIRLVVDGVTQASVTDASPIAAAGRAGVMLGFGASLTTVSDTTGMHLDDFRVYPPMNDLKTTNDGAYFASPILGVLGAITGDANTAATFDGVSDYASFKNSPTGGNDFSVEFWFKSTQGIGTGAQWWQGAGLVDADVAGASNDSGVSLRSDGRIVAGSGGGAGGADTSIVSSSGGYNDGAWHHVVITRAKASGVSVLYVDGVSAGTATGSTLQLNAAPYVTIGRIQSGGNYFAGSIDEVALYGTVLSSGAVAAHYGAGR